MTYLCSFLAVATTNLVATALSDADASASASRLEEVFGTATRLALLCGIVSAALQMGLGRSVLARYTAARSAAVVGPAYTYVRVRALGAPAALLARVSTATCLASKDPQTPLLAVAASGALNLILDLILVSVFGLGIGGAAWATVVSEVACAAFVLRAVRAKLGLRRRASDETDLNGWKRRLLNGRSLLPARAEVAIYAAFARPLLVTLAGKIATYSALAHVATCVSVVGTAAHRVLMCVYWFTWPFAEVCSQVGQAFLPGMRSVRPLLRKLLSFGAAVGIACGCMAGGVLAWAPQLFTSDVAVSAAIQSLAPLVTACIATLALMCAMEGALLATRQLGFLSTFYAVNAVSMVAAFAVVERLGLGLHAAWGCMLVFQLVRLAAFGVRLRLGPGQVLN